VQVFINEVEVTGKLAAERLKLQQRIEPTNL